MSAGDVLLFVLFAYGVAFGLQFKAIPRLLEALGRSRVRDDDPAWVAWIRRLAACPYCSGFWGGVAWISAPYLPPVIVYGLAAAAACFMFDRWTE